MSDPNIYRVGRYSWDRYKDQDTIDRRGMTFHQARYVFSPGAPKVTLVAGPSRPDGSGRRVTYGRISGKNVMVVHEEMKNQERRIISIRRFSANSKNRNEREALKSMRQRYGNDLKEKRSPAEWQEIKAWQQVADRQVRDPEKERKFEPQRKRESAIQKDVAAEARKKNWPNSKTRQIGQSRINHSRREYRSTRDTYMPRMESERHKLAQRQVRAQGRKRGKTTVAPASAKRTAERPYGSNAKQSAMKNRAQKAVSSEATTQKTNAPAKSPTKGRTSRK